MPQTTSELRLAGRDAVVAGTSLGVSGGIGLVIRFMIEDLSRGGIIHLGAPFVGGVLIVLGSIQWRTARPLAFAQRMTVPWSVWGALCVTVALVGGLWPALFDRLWPR